MEIYICLILYLIQFNIALINTFNLLLELKSIYLYFKFNLSRTILLR